MSGPPTSAPPVTAPAPPAGTPPDAYPPAPPDPPLRALLSPHVARLIGFVALAGFGALHWADLVRPAASAALLAGVLSAAAAGALLSTLARRRAPAGPRLTAMLVAGAVLLLVALAASGVPADMLAPRGWDDLAGGIAQGIGAVATVGTPYGGVDEWTRIVLILGGCLVTTLAALLAFAPRRGGAFGFPAAAAVALAALYTVPVMQHDVDRPWLAGLTFTLLLASFLWLERLEQRAVGPAAAVVALAALAGYVAAPALDRDRALLDYEEIAQSLSPTATTQYRWNHSYGPLDWPRDGREVLRVRSPRRSYWKAVNLVVFDGMRWVQDGNEARDPLAVEVYDRGWRHTIRVTLRALRSSQFVAAGSTLDILDSPRIATSSAPGVYETAGRPLRRGHGYRAVVYSPRPTAAQMRTAPADHPLALPPEYGVLRLPIAGRRGSASFVFPRWSDGGTPAIAGSGRLDARGALAGSPYRRVYELARRLRADAKTPFDYVRAVERHLARGFRYDESPPSSSAPLADFLLRDRVGYCQQFSGAMALLLRMGGVPARVVSGFSPGTLDSERREYVVRDVDAHSWVEVFVPGIGWTTRDPTPPDSPARTQLADLPVRGQDEPATFAGSERALGRTPDAGGGDARALEQEPDDGADSGVAISVAVVALMPATGLVLLVRRRRRVRRAAIDEVHGDPELAELLLALRRTGREPPPPLTLAALAEHYSGTPAQDYLRALAAARYGYGERRPTPAQRAALRRELGAGLGPRGRLRGWSALPPRRARRPPG